jgi:hypothetical protein
MSYTRGKRTQIDWANYIENSDLDVFGTLKFYNGETVGREKAAAIYTAYWHRVDQIFFGHAAKKGYCIERLCFEEYGESGDNLHIHFAAKSPIATHPFCAVLNAVWVNFNHSCANYAGNRIMPIIYRAEAAEYVAKDTRNLADGNLGLKLTRTHDGKKATDTVDTEAQIGRILKVLTGKKFKSKGEGELEKAYEAVETHIEQARIEYEHKQKCKAATARHGSILNNYRELVAEYQAKQIK